MRVYAWLFTCESLLPWVLWTFKESKYYAIPVGFKNEHPMCISGRDKWYLVLMLLKNHLKQSSIKQDWKMSRLPIALARQQKHLKIAATQISCQVLTGLLQLKSQKHSESVRMKTGIGQCFYIKEYLLNLVVHEFTFKIHWRLRCQNRKKSTDVQNSACLSCSLPPLAKMQSSYFPA